MSSLPLAGRRILVTRAAHQAGKLSQALRTEGAEPVEVPVLEIRPPESFEALDAALHGLDGYEWLILTSANAVKAIEERAEALGVALNGHRTLGVAAVGEATAMAAENAGFRVAVVPENYLAESLVEDLAAGVSGQKVLLARAAIARDVIPDALRAVGARVDVVDAYRNVMPERAPQLLREALEKSIDAVAFTSSSSVSHLAEAAKAAGMAFPLVGAKSISIGPITSATLREFGWDPAAEAKVSDIQGLVEAVVLALGG